MKRILVAMLLVFAFAGCTALTPETKVDSELLRDIEHGHQLLSQYTECLSGKIEISRGSSTTEKLELSSSRQILFFRDKDLLRLEYINPKKGTEIFPGHKKSDITQVFINSKNTNFEYRTVGPSSMSSAELSKSNVLSEAQKITLGADFYSNINALFIPLNVEGAKAVNLLRGEIGTIENRKYNDVADALWIRSPKMTDRSGSKTSWIIVLDPKRHYALLFFEVRMDNPKTEFTVMSSVTVSSQVTNDGKILPKEIVFNGHTKSLTQELNTGSRILVDIHSTDKPDERLFTEESFNFKNMGRDYLVVPPRGYAVDAAPWMPYSIINEFLKQEWSWTRTILFAAIILLSVIGTLRLRRRSKNK